MEMLFDLFPESFKRKPQKLRDDLLNVFRIKVLESPTLLQEESGIANEVFVILKGDITYYRKTVK